MSKAFTREDDSVVEETVRRPASSLPTGAKNYLTVKGEQNMRAELARLIEVERPTAASLPDEEESARELQLLDARINQLQSSLETAVVVQPPPTPHNQVLFGATVTVRDQFGESRYRIVGADEADLDNDEVSWMSPIAKALLNAKLSQKVKFNFPAGEDVLEIIDISY